MGFTEAAPGVHQLDEAFATPASLESKDRPHRHTAPGGGQAIEVTWVKGVRHQTYTCACGEVITR